MHRKPFRNPDPLLVDDEFLERLEQLVGVVQQQIIVEYAQQEGLDEEQLRADLKTEPFDDPHILRRHHWNTLRDLILPDIDIYYADNTQDDAASIPELREYLKWSSQRVDRVVLSMGRYSLLRFNLTLGAVRSSDATIVGPRPVVLDLHRSVTDLWANSVPDYPVLYRLWFRGLLAGALAWVLPALYFNALTKVRLPPGALLDFLSSTFYLAIAAWAALGFFVSFYYDRLFRSCHFAFGRFAKVTRQRRNLVWQLLVLLLIPYGVGLLPKLWG